ncbi:MULTISPECIES: AI-2E family transporter [Idiomarina]|jgi:predicted PurR-regulated permease PerM|uniref:AI-2E family transporter n=3 Tax=Idiomarina abyssalis TaxID=86102 RepID=A0A8I1G7M5_9GAMM|nr:MULTISPECIES: AI-2E family transporter [Idiomarina]MBJ7266743.1 AI-2E family transporter [Idiomarina abyssalis]MBJ7272990.1 AI-2E family transporter [Idiomarina abyssalis]MBJ7315666.1 AI-2E family transporter [Idiomarina abyssalis]MBP58111.1 AI-2E family transporter [Idiomarina sp.]|tara:strand:- start:6859 stop:7905 length:1047 start_codon:yes stop_codon:yes gene_type:complete
MRESLERRSFLLTLALVSVAFAWVLIPFWAAIFWACVVTVIFSPLQQRLKNKFGDKPNRAALVTLLIALVIVVIPVLGISYSFVQEGVSFYQRLDEGKINPGKLFDEIQTAFPVINDLLAQFDIKASDVRDKISSTAVSGSKFLAEEALSIGQNTFSFLISLALMIYLTFFLLRDGHRLINLMVKALPLGDERERKLFTKFAEVTRATVKGNLVVAIVQGALGGIIFALLGIPGALLWGVVMAFLSLIPAVGASLVWLPVSIYLYATGSWIAATILVAYGAIVIGLADNVLRPILVGRDTKLPDYLVLFSTLGGLSLFGITGFVLGPLVAALFLVFWDIFMTEFNADS